MNIYREREIWDFKVDLTCSGEQWFIQEVKSLRDQRSLLSQSKLKLFTAGFDGTLTRSSLADCEIRQAWEDVRCMECRLIKAGVDLTKDQMHLLRFLSGTVLLNSSGTWTFSSQRLLSLAKSRAPWGLCYIKTRKTLQRDPVLPDHNGLVGNKAWAPKYSEFMQRLERSGSVYRYAPWWNSSL